MIITGIKFIGMKDTKLDNKMLGTKLSNMLCWFPRYRYVLTFWLLSSSELSEKRKYKVAKIDIDSIEYKDKSSGAESSLCEEFKLL
jgi:hypothetical protein